MSVTAAQRRSIQARRTAMKATARRENPGLASALWRGAKSGYHGYRAARYEAKARQHRAWAKNPRIVGRIPGYAMEIRYQRTGSQPGRYRHPFEHNVQMYAMNDGSVLLRGSKKIHADDREKDFDQYVHPHHRRRNPMARRGSGGNSGWLLLIGVAAIFLLKGGAGGAAQVWWYNTADGTLTVDSVSPGETWRHATLAEVQAIQAA